MADPISAGAAVAGVVIGGVGALTDVAESIVEASSRNLVIQLTNRTSGTLYNPQVYLSNGQVLDPPPPRIPENKNDAFSFCKHDAKLEKVYGVITYDVCDIDGERKKYDRLAFMLFVPFDRLHYKNEFGFGVFSTETPCDEKLLEAMYSGSDQNSKKQVADGCQQSFSGKRHRIKGTMSQTSHATIKVDVSRLKKETKKK